MRPRFRVGQQVMTPGVKALLVSGLIGGESSPAGLVERHQSGDWGDLGAEDKQANEDAIVHDERILSCYHLAGQKIYVITEWDRSLTTVLLAEEY